MPNSDIFDAVVAFANTEGGDLYLGIEDSGEVTGVHEDHKNPLTLGAFIANNTIPPVSIRTKIIDSIHPVLKISVPKSRCGIVATIQGKVQRRRIKSDGTPENVPMYPAEYATRLSDLRMLDYSAMPVSECTIDDFDPIEIERLRNVILSYNGERALLDLQSEDLFKALGLVREINGRIIPTIAGILMIGRVSAIRRHVPTHDSSFQVLSGTDIKVNEDICLPLLSAIEKIKMHAEAWNPEQEIQMGLFRMSVSDFDKRAFREALINAFSHRDYSKMGRVRVAVSDDGLTIANPGGFIEGVSVKNLLTAEPHGRNPNLADALKRIGLAEKTGRGVDRIFEGALIYGNPLPDYCGSTSVTVSLFIPRSRPDPQIAKLASDEHKRLGRPLSLNTLLVYNALKDMPRSKLAEIADATNLTEIAVKAILDASAECGIVDIAGSGRNCAYVLSERVYATDSKRSGAIRGGDIGEDRYQEMIIALAKENDFISRSDVVRHLHVDESKAYRLLKALALRGILRPANKGRYAKYGYCGED